jgi:hypothetical protein
MNSKHLPPSAFTGSIFMKSRHLALGVYLDIWSILKPFKSKKHIWAGLYQLGFLPILDGAGGGGLGNHYLYIPNVRFRTFISAYSRQKNSLGREEASTITNIAKTKRFLDYLNKGNV